MKLTVIGSGSSGNAYLLQSANESLLIECGVNIVQIKRALNYKLVNVGCIVSHSHNDHSCSIKQVLMSGIPVYASKETLVAKEVNNHHRAVEIQAGQTFVFAGFKIKPFSVNHDVPTFGFLIHHKECGLTLFLTDTYYCDYVFEGLNNIIIEANHDSEIIENNGTPRFLHDRVIQSHMNIETCKDLLKANDLSAVNNIVLIHLSNSNSDAALFKREVEKITGKTVTIADEGVVIENFNKEAI